MKYKEESNPPRGCQFIAIILIVLFLFCAGYGFYQLFELAVELLR